MNKYVLAIILMLLSYNNVILADKKQDTISIIVTPDIILKYEKTDLDDIIERHPEFFNETPENPYTLYSCTRNHSAFGSEGGQDEYFLLYAYFLKQRNGIKEYEEQRETLIEIYRSINSLYQLIKWGGTYFGHQSYRTIGYAEYSVYLYKTHQYELKNPYDIKTQKQLYIQSLRQIVENESIDNIFFDDNDNKKRYKNINEIIDRLDSLITTSFYLKRTQEFHYSLYEYY